ncbi:hypothetical protein CH063_15052, partial [Colletotrichum higginsianum]
GVCCAVQRDEPRDAVALPAAGVDELGEDEGGAVLGGHDAQHDEDGEEPDDVEDSCVVVFLCQLVSVAECVKTIKAVFPSKDNTNTLKRGKGKTGHGCVVVPAIRLAEGSSLWPQMFMAMP